MKALLWIALLFVLVASICAKIVTLHNDLARTDAAGNVVDCHSGNILKHGDTYFLYGEHYGSSTGFNETDWPKLRVYTSKDLTIWMDQGWMINNAPHGTYFTPWVIFNQQTQMFVAWFNAYLNGCCNGGWGIAQSKDGIHFDIVTLNEEGKYDLVDCNGLFVDDDGTAYVVYSSLAQDHQVSIEKLSPDYLHTTKENYGLLPDHYVEGSALFKRNGLYYVLYGSCCCFCRAGAGVVVYTAKNIQGPWVRSGVDVNCFTTDTAVCGAYGERKTKDPLIIPAQIITVSTLETNNGTVYIWGGERWLSAPNNNPNCPDECRHCDEPTDYIKGNGFSYWYPLEFNQDGSIKQFRPFVKSFTLDIDA